MNYEGRPSGSREHIEERKKARLVEFAVFAAKFAISNISYVNMHICLYSSTYPIFQTLMSVWKVRLGVRTELRARIPKETIIACA